MDEKVLADGGEGRKLIPFLKGQENGKLQELRKKHGGEEYVCMYMHEGLTSET